MKKDIKFPAVEGVKIAIAKNKDEINKDEWYVYLLNQNDFSLKNVLITSKGYGTQNGQKQKTSTLRHMIEEIPANHFAKIEKIDPAIFHLCSEYWISYYIDSEIYDKKFVFMPESITDKNLIKIDMLDLEGILHS